MRIREKGMSMPSGDSAACAFETLQWLMYFDSYMAILVVLPLTMCGRVYVYCHWFGDTIVGAIIGTLFSLMFLKNMHIFGIHLWYIIDYLF